MKKINIFKDKPIKVVILEIVVILIGLIGITFAISTIYTSMNVTVATSKLEIDDINANVTSGVLTPLLDDNVNSTTTDNVLRISFSVKGKSTNNTTSPIYDVALKNIDANKSLLQTSTKWRLYKNGTLLTSGNLSPTFDNTITTKNSLTLTETQQDLPSSSSTADSYIFVLWLSDACSSSDITECTESQSASTYAGSVNGDISILLYSGKKKSITRTAGSAIVDDGSDIIPDPVSFSGDSWATIKANTTSSVYNVGDTKCIALTGFTTTNDNGCSSGQFKVRIANKSTPSDCSGSDYSQTACGFVIEFVDIISKHVMNPSTETDEYGTNVGSWPATSMRTYVNSDIYNALPSALQSVIATTKVVTGYGDDDSSLFTSNDKIYLLSPYEVGNYSGSYDTGKDKTRQLDYYSGAGVTTSSSSGAIKLYNSNDVGWWLRAPNSNISDYFFFVGSAGDWSSSYANIEYGVAPAFRIVP